MGYRADIDGLRAVAVVPVVLFHAGFASFSGGFIGVDVFFVISGFLITGIILGEMRAGVFSVLHFYERRARRILPALFAVLIFSLGVAWFLLLPLTYRSLGNSVVATTTFASNIYFWRQTGYFAGASEMFPLLHTWSLAVEEQFYIGFPLFLLLSWRWGWKVVASLIIVLSLMSLGLSIWALDVYPSATFFLLPTRAWELFIGSLLALRIVPVIHSRIIRELLALVGLILVVAPVFLYTKSTPFPGLAALPPCLGAAAIIWAGLEQPVTKPNMVARLLGIGPIVFIGLISYSLYLWHWPLLVFARYLVVSPDLDQATAIVTVLIASLAAVLSWRFIERPFRNRDVWSRKAIFTMAGAGTATLVAMSMTVFVLVGIPDRFEEVTIELASGAENFSKKGKACLNKPLVNSKLMSSCRLGPAGKPVEFVLWGDSHAAAITPAFEFIATRTGLAGGIIAFNACPALENIVMQFDSAKDSRNCWRHNREAFEYVMRSETIKTVFLTGFWRAYLRNAQFLQVSGNGEETNRIDLKLRPILKEMASTIERLTSSGKQIVILDNLPEPGFSVPWKLAMLSSRGKHYPVVIKRNKGKFSQEMRTVFKKNRVVEIPLDEAICTAGNCNIVEGSKTIFKDGNHLTEFGAATYYGPFLYNRLFGPNGVLIKKRIKDQEVGRQ